MSEEIQIRERQTIKIDGVEYYRDSLSEAANYALQDLAITEDKMQDLEVRFKIMGVAKQAILERLAKEKENMTPVEDQKESSEDSENTKSSENAE